MAAALGITVNSMVAAQAVEAGSVDHAIHPVKEIWKASSTTEKRA